MRFSKRRPEKLPELNMTPMIDVVFQLLIFFMTISQQVSIINSEGVELPKLSGSEDQERLALTINVTRDGTLRIAGQRVTIAGLVSTVSRELERLGGDVSRVRIAVRADERGRSRQVNEVIEAMAGLGILRIHLAVEKPK